MTSNTNNGWLRRQAGRIGASLALVAVLVLNVAAIGPSPWLQHAGFDAYQRLFPRERVSAPVIVVDIDEASLRSLGQWPWPRDLLADMIERIDRAGALAIGLDIYMPEPDRTSPESLAKHLPPHLTQLRQQLSQLPSHDEQLAQTMARSSVVLGAVGLDEETPSTSQSLRSFPLHIQDQAMAQRKLRQYPYVLASLPSLQRVATGSGLLSIDLEDGRVRRIPMVAEVAGQLLPALSVELLRVATGQAAIELTGQDRGKLSLNVADLSIPLLPDGRMWLHFSPYHADRYLSALDVLKAQAPLTSLRDKIVLIGLTGMGMQDRRLTPLRETVPGVDIQAQLLETMFDRHFLQRPAALIMAESLALLLIGGLMILLVPVLRPGHTLGGVITITAVCWLTGLLVFRHAGYLLDMANLSLGIWLAFICLMAGLYDQTTLKQRQAEQALATAREQAAKVAGELEAARRIQLGSLPQADLLFANEHRFAIAAYLEPARQVGGDLYDFMMLDADHLLFIVADVSGKGLPASLFMTVTKAMSKSVIMRQPQSNLAAKGQLSQVLQDIQRELTRDNPEMLFVTLFMGVLNVQDGSLSLVNAGHDAACWVSPGDVHRTGVRRIGAASGPPLCTMPDLPFQTEQQQLSPGDVLIVVTDGVVEAMNAEHQTYGLERLRQVIERQDRLTSSADPLHPKALQQALLQDIQTHTDGAEASDDLTLLVIRWYGTS